MAVGGRYRCRSPQALTGTIACAVMIGSGRWGAHIGIPPLYIGELLLALAGIHVWATSALIGRPKTGVAQRAHAGPLVAALLCWVVIRLAFLDDSGIIALRDFAPYGYAFISFLAASAYARSTVGDRYRTIRFIEVALAFHLLWVIPARFIHGGYQVVADGGVHPFVARPDADGTILAVTACLLLIRYLRDGGLWRLLAAVVSVGVMASMTSRAAMIATLVGLSITLWCYLLSAHRTPAGSRERRLAMAGVVPIAVITVAIVMPQTPAGSKLLASMGWVAAESRVEQGGLGSKRARSAAWDRVVSYTREEPTREAFGVGFGPNFMVESSASFALLTADSPDVRSPHNYFVGTFARLGLIGLALLTLLCVVVLASIWRVRRFAGLDDLLLLSAIVPPMILAEAAFGVVLEAPFGAIPFFWFLGILLSKPVWVPERQASSSESTQLVDAVVART